MTHPRHSSRLSSKLAHSVGARIAAAVGLLCVPLVVGTCRLDDLLSPLRDVAIEISIARDTIALADSARIVPTITVGGEPRDSLPVVWASSDAGVATVDATGLLRTVGRGKAVVSVRVPRSAIVVEDVVAQDTVWVIAASVGVAPADTVVTALGDTLCVRSAAFDARGDTIPGAAAQLTLILGTEGAFRPTETTSCYLAVANGTDSVLASLDTARASAQLAVQQQVTAVEITAPGSQLTALGATLDLAAAAHDRRDSVVADAAMAWTSSDAAVLEVDANGVVTALAEGTAYVRAAVDTIADSVAITVTPPVLVVEPDTLRASATEESGERPTDEIRITNRDGGAISWSAAEDIPWLALEATSNTTADTITATFNPDGLAPGTYEGTVTITSEGAEGSPHALPARFTVFANPDSVPVETLGQFRSSDGTAIAVGESIDETSVIFKGTVSDEDPGDVLHLEVELKPVGGAFDGTGTVLSAGVASGSTASVTISGIPDDNNYHWRARAVDQTGRIGPWTSFGGNQETQADFHIPPVAESPDAPTELAQFESDGTTPIVVGDSASQSTVVLKGRLTDPDPGDDLILDVEVQPVGTAFTNTATASSTVVPSGDVASVTVSGLTEDVDYHWQARTRDQTGRASEWVSFGDNAETATDFRVAVPDPPNAPANVKQFRSDGATEIVVGTTIDESTVVFKATVSDPDPGDELRLEVETKPLGSAFDGTGTALGAAVSSNAEASVTVSDQGDDTSYHWRVRTVDQTGRASDWVPFGGNTETDIDYRIVVPEPPAEPTEAAQKKTDGTAVSVGGTTDESSIVLSARLSDPDPGDQLRLEVEVKPLGTTFDGAGTQLSTAVASGDVASVTVTGLSDDTDYHWRLRARDQSDSLSAWVNFGGNAESEADFRVAVPQDPGAPSGLGQFESDGTEIPPGNTIDDNTVIFRAMVTDPDPGDLLKLQVEVQPVTTGFSDKPTATGTDAVASGEVASVTVGPLSDDDYHWQVRAVDQDGRAGPWVAFSAEGTTDFRVDVPGAPDLPTGLDQFRSDSITQILDGDTTGQDTVVLKGTVTDPDGNSTRLEVEVKPVISGFTGSGTVLGDLVASGSVAAVRVSGLADDTDHHWRARAVDNSGLAGGWVEFGTTATDFRVQVPEPPADPTEAAQKKTDGTAVSVGGTTDETSIVLSARLSDPDPGDQLRLEVEVKPVGTPLDGTGTQLSAAVASGDVASVTWTGLSDDTQYHWRLRALDQSDSASAWVGFGDNADSEADFSVAVPEPPAAPTDTAQFKQDGVTTIAVGATTDQNTVVLKATASDPDPGDELRLEVEVKPVGTTFNETGTTVSTSTVTSGNIAAVTVSGLDDDIDYHWRVRTLDQADRASAWVSFGNNAESEVDFRVAVPQDPAAPASLGQFTTLDASISVGSTTNETSVVFKGTLSDPDAGATLRLEVEAKPLGTALDGSATDTSAAVADGGEAQLQVDGLTDNTVYHWAARTIDETGRTSVWVSFGGNTESEADFTVDVAAEPPADPASLGQFKSDGLTTIAVGETTDESTVIFKATMDDPDPGAQIRLEVEVKTIDVAFDGAGTDTSAAVGPGQTASVTVSDQLDTSYHWRARAIDQDGNTSGWVSFPESGNADGPPADVDYAVAAHAAPLDPADLTQLKNNETTVIDPGATTDETTVVFTATVTDSETPDPEVRLVIEVKPVTQAFDGTAADTSAAVTSGSTAKITKTGLSDDTNYHWRAQTLAGETRTSDWVSFGTNLDGETDFRVAVPENPLAPDAAELRQLRSDGIGIIAAGDTTKTGTVIFRGRVSDPDAGDQVRMILEVKPLATAFDGLDTDTSAAVASGDTVTITLDTLSGLIDDEAYHWRARALDQTGRTSTDWTSFGGNLEGEADFHVWINENPSAPDADQYKTTGTTIPLGGKTDELTVVFKATVNDPDPGDSVRIEVERRPLGTTFSGVTHVGALVAAGEVASVSAGHNDNTSYHWRVRTSDKTGAKSAWVHFGGNAESEADYHIDTTPETPATPTSLGQFDSNGNAIQVGGNVGGLTVTLKGTVTDPDAGDQLTLEVEVKSVLTPFDGVGINPSDPTTSGQVASVNVTVLTGDHHWRARTCDQTGRCSGWISFGGNDDATLLVPGDVDFKAP